MKIFMGQQVYVDVMLDFFHSGTNIWGRKIPVPRKVQHQFMKPKSSVYFIKKIYADDLGNETISPIY